MASKKVSTPRRKGASSASSSGSEPVSLSKPKASPQAVQLSGGKFSGAGLLGLVVVVCLLAFFVTLLWKHRPQMPGAPSPTAAAHPVWGPDVKLEVISKFKVPDEVESIKADAKGTVYLLTHSAINRYVNGQRTGSIDLKVSGEFMNMAFDGENFYVAMAGDPNLRKVPKDLSRVDKPIKLHGAISLLGVGANGKGLIYAGDLQTHNIYVIDGKDHDKGLIGAGTGLDCPVDVAVDLPSGDVFVHDHLTWRVDRYNHLGALLGSWPVPWTSHQNGWERLCVVDGKIYIDGFNDGRLFIQDLQGNNIAQCRELSSGEKLNQPQMVGAGLDGFLYVKNADTIYKLRPYTQPEPTAVPAK